MRHLRAIRAIQAHLSSAAARHAVPEVDNTNVDRSVATIHATVLGCLRRQAAGTPLVHAASEQCRPVLEEYLACKSAKWSGTDMLELIRKKAAAGEAPSPPDAPSTSAASTAATPKIGLTRSLSLGAPPPSGAAGEQKGHVPVPVAVQVPVSNGQQAPQHPAEQGGAIEEEDCDDGRSFHGDGANSSEDGEGEEGEKGSEGGSGTAGHALQKVSDFGSVLELEDGRSEAG